MESVLEIHGPCESFELSIVFVRHRLDHCRVSRSLVSPVSPILGHDGSVFLRRGRRDARRSSSLSRDPEFKSRNSSPEFHSRSPSLAPALSLKIQVPEFPKSPSVETGASRPSANRELLVSTAKLAAAATQTLTLEEGAATGRVSHSRVSLSLSLSLSRARTHVARTRAL